MSSASRAETTASGSTSQKRAIFSRIPCDSGSSERATMMSGWIPISRSSATECCVGLVLASPTTPITGTSVTWMYRTLSRPMSLRNWRIASRNGRLSMSPTVPPTSVMSTSAPVLCASRWTRLLISLVMCGMTWTVPPR